MFFPGHHRNGEGLTFSGSDPHGPDEDLLCSDSHTFFKLRWPSSTPFLFASLKVSIAISLVGAIVGELPAGAQAGLGARLLTGSYYGQTIQIWSALICASILAAILVFLMIAIEKIVLKKMGGRLV